MISLSTKQCCIDTVNEIVCFNCRCKNVLRFLLHRVIIIDSTKLKHVLINGVSFFFPFMIVKIDTYHVVVKSFKTDITL